MKYRGCTYWWTTFVGSTIKVLLTVPIKYPLFNAQENGGGKVIQTCCMNCQSATTQPTSSGCSSNLQSRIGKCLPVDDAPRVPAQVNTELCEGNCEAGTGNSQHRGRDTMQKCTPDLWRRESTVFEHYLLIGRQTMTERYLHVVRRTTKNHNHSLSAYGSALKHTKA